MPVSRSARVFAERIGTHLLKPSLPSRPQIDAGGLLIGHLSRPASPLGRAGEHETTADRGSYPDPTPSAGLDVQQPHLKNDKA